MKIEFLNNGYGFDGSDSKCFDAFNTLIVLQSALFSSQEDRPLNWMVDYLADNFCWQETLEIVADLTKKNLDSTLYLFDDAFTFVTEDSPGPNSESVTYGIVAKNEEEFLSKAHALIDALRAVRMRHADKRYLSTDFKGDLEYCRNKKIVW